MTPTGQPPPRRLAILRAQHAMGTSTPSSPGSRPAPRRPRSPAPVIDVRDVRKTYQMGDIAVHALRGLRLSVQQGEYVAIMGTSGSGKSTLMNIIGCLDVPSAGAYLLNGLDVRDVDEDDLADLRNRFIGFVFQNFNLIPRTRALVTNPSLILADEPTGNLDTASTAEVLSIFRRLSEEGRTVVLITHEHEVAAHAQRVIQLRDGQVIADEPSEAGERTA